MYSTLLTWNPARGQTVAQVFGVHGRGHSQFGGGVSHRSAWRIVAIERQRDARPREKVEKELRQVARAAEKLSGNAQQNHEPD